MPEQKKIFGPLEIVVFLITVGLLAYMAFKSGGINITERTETVEIVDDLKEQDARRAPRKYRETEEENVDVILRQIADQYSGKPSNTPVQKEVKSQQMSQDELAYLESVKQKEKQKRKAESVDWFSVLSASHKTYKKVKSAFENAGIDVEKAENNVTSKLVNEVAARSFYNKMEEMFDIPKEDAKAFAAKGEKALSDWARFVDEKAQ